MEDSKSRTIFSTLEDAKARGTGMVNRTLDLLAQIPQKIQSHMKLVDEREHSLSSPSSLIKKEKMPTWNINLEKQLRTWKENPEWVDHSPEIKITVPKGALCNLSVKFKVGLPPDAIYNIVTDPNNKRVFKNIKEVISRKVLLDEGLRQVVEVEQAALWRFLWWSGTISVHVLVDQNRENHTVSFKQGKSGFMKRFEGCWTLQPLLVDEELCSDRPHNLTDYESCSRGRGRVGSLVSLEQLIQPSVVPPPPISWYLRGITARTTEMLIDDLLAEAARVRECGDDTIIQESDMDNRGGEGAQHYYDDIKERWRLRRRRQISQS